MKTLTLNRIRELDEIWNRETLRFVALGIHYGAPHPLFLHRRRPELVDFDAMSQKWDNASEEDLRKFIELRRAISGTALNEDGAIELDELILDLEISASEVDEFQIYFHSEVRQIREIAEEESDPLPSAGFPWETGKDLEEDLQADADVPGQW